MTQLFAVTLHVFAVTPVKPNSKGYYIHLKLHDLLGAVIIFMKLIGI